jgi:proteasome beta subunit
VDLVTDPTNSSFFRHLLTHAPENLPWNKPPGRLDVPHGTTVLAARYADGVLMAGDRRATMGNLIAQRDMEKVYPADEHSGIAFAGTVGLAIEMVKLFQVELEHYERIEGVTLSIEGKVNKLGAMVRSNFAAAEQGMAVIPLFAGWDDHQNRARIFSADVVGHMTEEKEFEAVGSGSTFAKGALKKLWRRGMTEEEVAGITVQALVDAADEDSATGGPDLTRQIFPLLATITAEGYRRYTEEEVRAIVTG